ncbi:MAG: hypothetical protein R3321_00890 [Nitrososphaeraceae archaeon]|nr:hypothetical protein [Nitrososphaeraceae archaeon]
MPDPQSGMLSKQEKNIHKEMDEASKNHDFVEAARNRSQLYNTGLDIIESLGYKLQLDERGAFCLHDIYKAVCPSEDIKGINYPSDFTPYIKVTNISDVYELYDNFCEEADDDELIEFWLPLWMKPNTIPPLEVFASNKLNLEKQAFISSVKRDDILELYHSFYYDVNSVNDEYYKTPLTWVPARPWFDEKIQRLKFKDIITLFPEAELELLKLIFGRIGVGISGHQPPGTDIVINHTYRMAGIVVGREAGLICSSV